VEEGALPAADFSPGGGDTSRRRSGRRFDPGRRRPGAGPLGRCTLVVGSGTVVAGPQRRIAQRAGGVNPLRHPPRGAQGTPASPTRRPRNIHRRPRRFVLRADPRLAGIRWGPGFNLPGRCGRTWSGDSLVRRALSGKGREHLHAPSPTAEAPLENGWHRELLPGFASPGGRGPPGSEYVKHAVRAVGPAIQETSGLWRQRRSRVRAPVDRRSGAPVSRLGTLYAREVGGRRIRLGSRLLTPKRCWRRGEPAACSEKKIRGVAWGGPRGPAPSSGPFGLGRGRLFSGGRH